MLAWTVAAALNSGVFGEVVVSTEDEEIAGIAAGLGARVHERPQELAQDLSSSTDVCLDAAGPDDVALVCLQPSSPLVSPRDIRDSWEEFARSGVSFLVSVTPIDPHYFHWALEQQDGEWAMFFGDRYMRDRLELPAVFRPNGAIKIAQVEKLRRRGNFFGTPLGVHHMPEDRSVHVATELDARVAESLLLDRAESAD